MLAAYHRQANTETIRRKRARKREWLLETFAKDGCVMCHERYLPVIDLVNVRESPDHSLFTDLNASYDTLKQKAPRCTPLCKNCRIKLLP